jgi:hypothetical protein
VKANSLKEWGSIDLETLAKTNVGGSKKNIDLVLKKDGDLLMRGAEDPLMNVTKSKSIAPVANLISADAKIELTKKDLAISTLEKIISRWVDSVFEEYLDGKVMGLVDSRSKGTKLVHFGPIRKDQLGLYTTHRNQPWAEVYMKGTRHDKAPPKPKAEPKAKKSKGANIEDLGRSLKK